MTWRREVFETMGTVVSLVADVTNDASFARTRATFVGFDERYSLFKPASELSRIARGELRLDAASEELLELYASALDWRSVTSGGFTPHRPDGVIDLSGIVKAAAMEEAGAELRGAGVEDWCLNVGGDVLTSGTDAGGLAWSVGIVDPADRSTLLTSTVLAGSRRACATSGSAERGDHIWTVGADPTSFVQVTVLADDIVTADVLATAIVSGGPDLLDQLCTTHDIDVLTVDRDDNLRITPGFARERAAT